MCEWLSCREWCDVQLLCGGRAFGAHRAVLASASSFLRKLLLSCPSDDSPTFIVLPEFDFEAVSSMLYYIYNGEVIIQKPKMKMFLDIIKAMQIFIDGQYLQDIRKNNTDNTDVLLSEYWKSLPKNVEFRNNSYQGVVSIMKQGKFNFTSQQHAFQGRENQTIHQEMANASISLHNMQSTHADRQRNSFLRDLFTETHPRNGIANGCTGSVLELSNERYRTPTSVSVLLANANGNHHGDDTRPGSFGMGITSPSSSVSHPWKWTHDETKRCSELHMKNINLKSLTDTFHKLPGSDNTLFNYFPVHLAKSDLRKLFTIDSSVSNFKSITDKTDWHEEIIVKDISAPGRECLKESNLCTRGTILNKVLESPWCSRVPNSFKPFRRKDQNEQPQNLNFENRQTVRKETNDNNNNVQILKPIDTTLDTRIKSNILPTERNADKTDINERSICNKTFPSSDLLACQKKLHSVRYSCDQCSKTFSQLRNFKYHMSVHRGTREFAATCPVCGKYFNDRGYLSSHMKIHRNRKEYKCPQCPKSFNQRVAYNMHVRIHTGVKPHVCEQCGKAFSRKMLLKQHLRTHSGERPYACAHCDKRFADRSNMTLHLRLHTGVKPFSCPLCPKAFTKKHHLKSHLNFHTGAKPYSCPRCKLAFTQSSNMRTHFKKCMVEPKDK